MRSPQWEPAYSSLTSPLTDATTTRNRKPPFKPLPGLSPIRASEFRKGGDLSKLHVLYGGLASRRLLIIGDPGAGKSAAAIQLLLDALEFRARAANDDRHLIPVPVIFTLHGWDPAATTLEDWLTTKLAEIPLFRGRRGARIARRMLADDRIAFLLDGLDEAPDNLRPGVLRALSDQATFRLVLLTRSEELAAAVERGPLTGAAGIRLKPVTGDKAATYLRKHLVDPPPPGWDSILRELADSPGSALTKALSTPLAITLLRDAYRDNKPDELLDAERFPTSEAIDGHLLDHALIAAYTTRPGQPRPRYPLKTAKRSLGLIALALDGKRDLVWWHIPRWISKFDHILIAVATILGMIPVLRGIEQVTVSIGKTDDLDHWKMLPYSIPVFLWIGLALGLIKQCISPTTSPKRTQPFATSSQSTRRRTRNWFTVGFATGLAVMLAPLLSLIDHFMFLPVMATMLISALWFGLASALAARLTQPNISDTRPTDPLNSRRRDLTSGLLIGLVIAFSVYIPADIGPRLYYESTPNLVGNAAPLLLSIGLAAGFSFSAVCSTLTTQAFLRLNGSTPLRLMRFLEDARARGVLRTVGPVYQFRHAKLQDRLAEHQANLNHRPTRDLEPTPSATNDR